MPTRLAGERRGGVLGGGQHDRDGGRGGDPGRLDLGHHAAGADRRAAPGRRRRRPDRRRRARPSIRRAPGSRRVRGVEAVDVAEQDQRVGVDQMGDQGRQPVVVAEADLVGGDGVVLVDDRDDAELQQPAEGAVARCGSGCAG